MEKIHDPALTEELKVLLNLKECDNAIDATMDGGGHAQMMLGLIGEKGTLLGIDQDEAMIQRMSRIKNLLPALGNFRNIDLLARQKDFGKARAILFDLGMSRWHLEQSGRGFSFGKPKEPLLMNLGTDTQSAAEIVNQSSERELTRIFREFGEEPRAALVAKKVVLARKNGKILSVGDFLGALGIEDIRGKERLLARIFQALRIAVNDELDALLEGLRKGFEILLLGGRIAVISYHSLEDRIVKNFFKKLSAEGRAKILTKKPIVAGDEEIKRNPSARSAKLRVLEKT
ncbi:16S rRNA (cytosine(1402)-N(4))-methyltransferase [Candidatus Giovannonibacteria bacterium RIFCSPHIGHO2_01_FULL_45_24]|uniref:Ribosomal RNA small subunit methyltransferase H n=1 Tax=Candidatus Giovannonibacteria bacterium RIFCSPLOWO2_01_FULL_46_32 TaxID=1798353 RepID=A0A1F5XG16_9BACT|nr:MAG: 16S rRNA (cytosine(1402)-N(4))-methyltransferase [Candidatus Giovannonibacteria bacterium RIFCSPHIGHO2_01_FULL_45_24]OGF86868.1 MAG: 16S rRNA (cytosine(1402)-N(4))-methyltransferase [Candidatus Giovannonibacteria bacterium RIFCSPLOWO2_01_FULL_46_32]